MFKNRTQPNGENSNKGIDLEAYLSGEKLYGNDFSASEVLEWFSDEKQGYFDLHNNGAIVNVSNLITGSGNGYGGIFSNVYDLNVFIANLLVDKTIMSDASLIEMQNFYIAKDDFYTGAGMIKKFTDKSAFGIGHTGRDLAYSADLFYFPSVDVKMVFFVNYGTNGKSSLKEIFEDFENELVDEILK